MGRIRTQDIEVQRKRLARESGTVRKDWGGRLPIALCYPNSYAVGMCNLGFQSVYACSTRPEAFVCERVFAEPVLIGSRSAGRGDWTGDDQYRIESRLQAAGRTAVGRVAASADRLPRGRLQPVVRARLLQRRRRAASSRHRPAGGRPRPRRTRS